MFIILTFFVVSHLLFYVFLYVYVYGFVNEGDFKGMYMWSLQSNESWKMYFIR